MTARQDGDERLLDHALLSENHRADGRFGGAHMNCGGFRGADDRVFQFFWAFAVQLRHSKLLFDDRIYSAVGYSQATVRCNSRATKARICGWFRSPSQLTFKFRRMMAIVAPFTTLREPLLTWE